MTPICKVRWHREGSSYHCGDAIPTSDRGVRYGMSVFETIAVCDGKMRFSKAHAARLRAAIAATELIAPTSLRTQFSSFPAPNGMLRIYVTAGDGDPGAAPALGRWFAHFEPRIFPISLRPASLAIHPLPVAPLFAGHKTGNYWTNQYAAHLSHTKGFEDALMFNPDGHLISCSMANIFLQLDDVWQTPSLTTGARKGVVRDWVRTQWKVRQTRINADDLSRATAAFMTSSGIGIRAVRFIKRRKLLIPSEVEHLAAAWNHAT